MTIENNVKYWMSIYEVRIRQTFDKKLKENNLPLGDLQLVITKAKLFNELLATAVKEHINIPQFYTDCKGDGPLMVELAAQLYSKFFPDLHPIDKWRNDIAISLKSIH